MASSVSQLQQVLFIVFTIVGFFLCIVSVALRADMWFKDEWSSFILGTFAPYIVSACLAAKIFLLETGNGGLRFVLFFLRFRLFKYHFKDASFVVYQQPAAILIRHYQQLTISPVILPGLN